MALPKLFNLITWHNNTTPAINEDNLNAMSQAIDDIDDRVIGLAGTIMEDVPQIQEDIEELEEDFALIDEKIADATSEANRATTEANRATTKANEAAASVISAGNKALISEGYAKGTQNGTPVGSSSPYYHNNAEYFKEQARSFTPTGYQDLVDDVAEAQEAITDIEGEKVSSNDAYVLRQGKGNMVDLDLVGGSVAWNQLIQNGNFASTSGWTGNDSSLSASGNVLTVAVGSGGYAGVYTNVSLVAGHKYLCMYDYKVSATGIDFYMPYTQDSISSTAATHFVVNNTNWNRLEILFTVASTVSTRIGMQKRNNTTQCTLQLKNFVLFDLTALFGSSTIADYIYALEQATAGAGVAWFRQYFSNAYYGYQSGKIESVNPSSRKVVGKNLLKNTASSAVDANVTFTVNLDGSVSTSGKSNATGANPRSVFTLYNGVNPLKIGESYTLSGCPANGGTSKYELMCLLLDSNNNTTNVSFDYGSEVSFTVPVGTVTMRVYIRTSNNIDVTGLTFYPMIRLATIEDDTYEPHQSSTYDFDPSIQLRGIPKLVDNKLSYDGDLYTADGSITRKYGIVDLGTLNWSYNSSSTRFYADLSNAKMFDSTVKANIICAKYITDTYANIYDQVSDKAVALHNNVSRVIIRDTAYTDAAAFKTAMSGVYLVYELATPTTESANAYQNPQRAFSDGTEEFVDYGVQSASRDVSIPVGNESEYNTSVVLPISQDYTDGAMEILKEIVASSSDFADFKTKVAAL